MSPSPAKVPVKVHTLATDIESKGRKVSDIDPDLLGELANPQKAGTNRDKDGKGSRRVLFQVYNQSKSRLGMVTRNVLKGATVAKRAEVHTQHSRSLLLRAG